MRPSANHVIVPSASARHFQITINNWVAEEYRILIGLYPSTASYVVIGKETCPTSATPHIHAHVYLKTKTTANKVCSYFSRRPHVEIVKDVEASIAYCKKDGDFNE